ncbi:hypothetical protein CROQUDRAFT_94492 [Cronartium quercuum f. sp. fusiforme G11]|uniref:F-box domain-containing protein n=1 Tax=Cronartium quercuum f. sp. fusiforme G11 TaxID=708437 RepID=A0A9P6TAS1_9BASI|nr:hypothetical protein CROQUDRAFT_94492 [Cronartium quercuum f. sp. fusiforme G11]
MPCLTDLPIEVITEIVLAIAALHPYHSPSSLLSLLLLNRRLYSRLRPDRNPSLYSRLFRSRFDVAALYRRFFNTLEPAQSSEEPTRSRSTAIQLCEAYIDRLQLFKRMRLYAATPPVPEQDPETDLAPYNRAPTISQPHGQPISLLTRDLWLIYLMVMENDEKNWIELIKAGQVVQFLKNFHHNKLVAFASQPGYPPEAPETAIGMRLYYLFVDLTNERQQPNAQIEEARETNLFVLKPYVFGCHVFEVAYAPWSWRRFPHPNTTGLEPIAGPSSIKDGASTDVKLTPLAVKPCTLQYMGQSLHILPPLNSHVALVSFFWGVSCMNELNRVSDLPSVSSSNSSAEEMFSQKMQKILSCKSTAYELDFRRATVCLDPSSSSGLEFDSFKGAFEGTWEGKFSFFDYTSYREMLMGRLQSVYEGRYGDQPQMFKMREVVVRKRDGQSVCFKPGPRPTRVIATHSEKNEELDSSEDETEHLLRMHIPDASMPAEEIEFDPNEEYELQIYGTGHSAWGKCLLKGRVRAWDGLLTLLKNYRADATVSGAAEPLRNACWLYRGYATPDGALIGRWRDTYTPPHIPGYEGTFIMFPR